MDMMVDRGRFLFLWQAAQLIRQWLMTWWTHLPTDRPTYLPGILLLSFDRDGDKVKFNRFRLELISNKMLNLCAQWNLILFQGAIATSFVYGFRIDEDGTKAAAASHLNQKHQSVHFDWRHSSIGQKYQDGYKFNRKWDQMFKSPSMVHGGAVKRRLLFPFPRLMFVFWQTQVSNHWSRRCYPNQLIDDQSD